MFTYRIEIKLIKIGVVNIKLKLFSYNKIHKVYKNRCCCEYIEYAYRVYIILLCEIYNIVIKIGVVNI